MKINTLKHLRRFNLALAAPALIALLPMTADASPFGFQSADVPAAKPTAPIAIRAELQGQPEVGLPVEVVVAVSVQQDMSDASLSVAADDPLAIIDPLDSVALGEIAVGETRDVSVTVLPLVVQPHYLSITVSGIIDGHLQSRSIGVPIRLPGAELRKAESDATGKPEERVRSFEAIETVR